jgi:hypothetical protein
VRRGLRAAFAFVWHRFVLRRLAGTLALARSWRYACSRVKIKAP